MIQNKIKKKELFNVFDFVGLVRCIAQFNDIDEIVEVEYMVRSKNRLARAIFGDFDAAIRLTNCGYKVKANIGNLKDRPANELLFIAAHEVGHAMCDHFSFGKKFASSFGGIGVELEANRFARQYSSIAE